MSLQERPQRELGNGRPSGLEVANAKDASPNDLKPSDSRKTVPLNCFSRDMFVPLLVACADVCQFAVFHPQPPTPSLPISLSEPGSEQRSLPRKLDSA